MFPRDLSPPADPDNTVDISRYSALTNELAESPSMPQALRRLCEGLGAQLAGGRMLNLIAGDRGRLALGWIALYLDAGREPGNPGSGLTVNRFKALCASTGLCSPGRAGSMLGVMRFAGYIEPAGRPVRGMTLQLIPTAKFMAQQRLRYEGIFEALRHVAPEGAAGLDLLDIPDFPRRFVRGAGDWFLAGARPLLQAPSLLGFAERKAGLHVLLRLVLSGSRTDTMPPAGPISLSIADCAKRFAVSRPQVKDVLDRAVADSLLLPIPGGAHSYVLSSALRSDCLRFGAAALALAVLGIRAAAASGPMSRA